MSHILTLIAAFEAKIQKLEQSIVQAASLAKHWSENHQGLIGMLQATKEALTDTKSLPQESLNNESANDNVEQPQS